MKTKKLIAVVISLLLILTVVAGCGSDQPATGDNGNGGEQKPAETSFPEDSIDMTILFGAGGGADVVGRKLADLASEELGQPIVCNNRTGAGGAVGYQYVLAQDPDGYNIVWNSTSVNVTYHKGNMPEGQDYSAFRGVANITKEASALAVSKDSQWNDFEEFVQYVKEHPGEVKVANSGVGSFNHLTAAAIEDALGVEFKHVPMDAKKSTTALIGGQVDAMVNMAFDVIQQAQADTVKPLVVVGEDRLEQLPDVPTMTELGYDCDLMMYRGIAVPKETPDEVVKVLEDAFVKAANTEEFKNFASKYGVIVNVMGASEFDDYMAETDQKVEDLMEKIGLKKQ